jgi:sigma-B regulation protein RsbU (phosphoserine phosphatase)
MTTIAEKKNLLLVDDDPENIQILHNILGDEYKIRVAIDGFKALELAKVKPLPDLILLDVIMPHRDGYEVCSHLKADPSTRDILVIFLTGKTGVADETHGFQVGAVDYIHKPFSPPIVTARVRTHLMLREAHETVTKQLFAMSKELELARQVQLSILPQEIPKIQGLEIAARYLPMSSVGGDFYDFIVVDEKHIGVLICDVAGHGLSAALIASMVQTALAAQSAHASDPVQVLSRLNQALHGKFESHHVTAAYVFVDMEKNTVNYAGAGHPPLLIWRAKNSEATECVENGLMLGPFSDPTYSAVSFSIEKGDRILLVTDGILEAVDSSGSEFGTDRLRQVLESKHALPASRFVDALLYGLSAWSEHAIGSRQADDITVLIIAFKECNDQAGIFG